MKLVKVETLKQFLDYLKKGKCSIVKVADDTQTEMVGMRMLPTTLVVATAYDYKNDVIVRWTSEDRSEKMTARTTGLTSRLQEVIELCHLHGIQAVEGEWTSAPIQSLLKLL